MAVNREWMSVRFENSFEANSIQAQFKIAWEDVDAFVEELFSHSFAVGGVFVFRGEPFPGRPRYTATRCSIEPFGDGNVRIETDPETGACAFPAGAIASVTYEVLNSQQDPDNPDLEPLVVHRYQVGAEFLTIPNKGLYFDGGDTSDPIPEDLQAGQLIPMIEWEATFPRIAEVPAEKIRGLVGHVNQSAWRNAAPETVLFLGAEVGYSFTPNQEVVYSMSYRFSEKRVKDGSNVYGWNHFMDPEDGNKWKVLLKKTDGSKIYPAGNLEELFNLTIAEP